MERDTGEPGAEALRVAEFAEAEPSMKHSFLNGVFGERWVAHNALAQAQRHMPMARNEDAEGRVIAATDLLDENGIWVIAMLNQQRLSQHSAN